MYEFLMKKAKRSVFFKRPQFYFVMIAPNGEVVMTSELQSNRDDMITTINGIKQGCVSARIVDATRQ